MQLFGTKGQKILCCPGTKGQAQNLATGRGGPGQPVKIRARCGTGQGFDILPQHWPGRDFHSLSRPGISRDNHGTEGKKKYLKIFGFLFVSERTRTKGQRDKDFFLSRDKGTWKP